jgi:hypothetical protein
VSDYDNPMIAALRRNYWSSDEDAGQIWDSFVQGFVRMSPQERRQSLLQADNYLSEQIQPTRETAAMIRQRRDLEEIHLTLHRAGR